MWKLLKAEIHYNRAVILTAYSIMFLALLASLRIETGIFDPLSGLSSITFFVTIGIMGSRGDKEKHDRFYMRLPLNLREYSMVRLGFIILYQLSFFVFLLILYFVGYAGEQSGFFWSLCAMNAFILIVISFFALYHDLGYFFKRMYQVGYLALLVFIVGGTIYMFARDFWNDDFLNFGPETVKTPLEAILFNLVFIGMFYLNHVIFMRRKSFLS